VMWLAVEAARGNPALIRRLFAVLATPFAVHMMDESRARSRLDLARMLPPGPECAEALDYFEPHVPWQADFLAFRAACYQRMGNAVPKTLVKAAEDDLREFRRESPATLGPLP